jgi:hypothetical protein
MKPLPVPLPVTGPSKLVMTPASRDDDELEEPTTQPNMPAAKAAIEAAQQKRGELGELLAAVSPFLWSLEDAARWADEKAAAGDKSAKNHARTLFLLARILAQLQARIDETGA